MSGGEQQMLAVARALMSNPKALMLDEPTTGLAPRLAREAYVALGKLRDAGCDEVVEGIGRTGVVGGDIYVYTGTGGSVSTGKIRRMGDGYTVDFRGSTNVYRIGKLGDDLVFYGSNGVSVGKVRHNGAMRRYEAQRDGSTATIAEFPDSIDPVCAALLFYNFFD